jgi:hypothetical protein
MSRSGERAPAKNAGDARRDKCGYRDDKGLWAPLVCGREKGHTGLHMEFRSNVTVGFGPEIPKEAT